ncbi:MAG TPA: FadR/GntR family transcriptional regulator [Chloroflexota bacterium]
MFIPVSPVRTYEELLRQIKAGILDGSFPLGSKLPAEREIARQFGVSRTTVREALTVLRETGLVEIRTGAAGGAKVTAPGAKAIAQVLQFVLRVDHRRFADLLEVRQTIEPRIAMLAAEHRSEQDVAALAESVERLQASLDAPEAYALADVAFHLQLARASANVIYQGLLDSLRDGLLQAITELAEVPALRKQGLPDHQRVLQAIRHHDAAEARRHMLEHFALVRQAVRYLDRLDKREDGCAHHQPDNNIDCGAPGSSPRLSGNGHASETPPARE